MPAAVRRRVLAVLFGGGPGGTIAAFVASWLGSQMTDAIRREPERLDTTRLIPGETYVVTTRPAPRRAERVSAAEAAKVAKQLESERRPTRRQQKLGRALARADRKADAASVGSRRHRKFKRRRRLLAAELEKISTPSRRETKLVRRLAALEAVVDRERNAALEKASSRTRPPRRQTFR